MTDAVEDGVGGAMYACESRSLSESEVSEGTEWWIWYLAAVGDGDIGGIGEGERSGVRGNGTSVGETATANGSCEKVLW